MADLRTVPRLRGEHLYHLPIVGGCALDPAKARVAYVVTRLDEAENAYRGSERILDLSSGAMQTLTDGDARDGVPQWSPDGAWLYFTSDRGGTTQLWRVAAAGGQPEALASVPGNVSEFAVCPDAVHIAAVTTPTAQRDEAERRGWRRISRLRYRADGPGFFDDLPQIWLLDVRAGSARALTHGEGFVGGVSWDPAGATLAFAGEHDPDADALHHRELWIAGAAQDFTPRKIAQFGSAVEGPSFSPDGTRIAFCGLREPRSGGGLRNVRLWVVDRDGQGATCLTEGEEWTCGNFVLTDVAAVGTIARPLWRSADEIAVLGSHRGCARVYAVTLTPGARARPLTPDVASVTEFALASGEHVVYCASDLATPSELYVALGDGVRRLTRESAAFCEAIGIGPAQRLQVATPSGAIEAWHIKGRAAAPRPCILQIHGGPHFAYGTAYVFEFMLLAAAGFDVVFCNPRGSQTYGEDFAAPIKGDWGRPAYEDCIAALDAAIARFGMDATRLGVAGGSYGGYLTGFCIGQTTRFGAAIAMRPAANLSSLWGTSEVGRMLAEDFGGRPQDVPDVYRRDSVLTYADAIQTPLLIINSENDYRTPAEQSEQLFTALRERGATVEMLRFMRCDHNLSRSGPPRARVTRLEAIVEWFERFLS